MPPAGSRYFWTGLVGPFVLKIVLDFLTQAPFFYILNVLSYGEPRRPQWGAREEKKEKKMKRKVGTVLEEDLLWKAKRAAVREKKTLSLLLEEALQEHLTRLEVRGAARGKSLVEETRGAMKVRKELLKAVLAEEGFYEAG